MFVRKLIALFMALAIANPACCCVLKTSAEIRNDHSCCSSTSENSNDSEKNEEPCNCSFAKEKASPEPDAILPNPDSAQPPMPTLIWQDYPDYFTKLSEVVTFLKQWPPGTLPVPTSSARLATKCSYLI